MAYVRSPNETWQKQKDQNNGLYSEGGGSVAGGSSGVSNQASNTKAGNAAGWYNIQDFLGANKGNQSLQNQIKDTGQDYINKANEEASGLYDQYNTHERPEAQAFDPSKLGVGGYDETAVQQGMNQDYDPFDVQGAMGLSQDSMNPYENIQSGSVQNLVDFNAQGMKPDAQYTSGMNMMDTALLGNDYDFVNNYGNEFKGQFENQVLNPFNEQVDAFAANEANLDKSFEDEQGAWRGGVEEWLKGSKGKVDSAYSKMQQDYNKIANADPSSYVDDQTKAYYDAQVAHGKEMPSFSDYIRQTGGSLGGPNEGHAAYSALGGDQGIDYYNALSSLYGDATAGEENPWGYNSYSGSQWSAPTYEFDKDAYMNAARGGTQITQSADEYTTPVFDPNPEGAGDAVKSTVETNPYKLPTDQEILSVGGDTGAAADSVKNFIGGGGSTGRAATLEEITALAKRMRHSA